MKLVLTVLLFGLANLSYGQAWEQKGDDLVGEAEGDEFGGAVAMNASGDVMIIGARYNDGAGISSGHVRVYEWDGSVWEQKGVDINGSIAGEQIGRRVAISDNGNIIAFSVVNTVLGGSFYSSVRIFEWNGSGWVQRGDDIFAESPEEEFGWSLDMNANGNRIITSLPFAFGGDEIAGTVRVFEWDDEWVQLGPDINGDSVSDFFGDDVAINNDGSIIAVGATESDAGGSQSGMVRILEWDGASWNPLGDDILGEEGNLLGYAVDLDIDGNTVLIGASSADIDAPNDGFATVYTWDGTSWTQKGDRIVGENGGDFFGSPAKIRGDGDMFIASAVQNDDAAENAGQVSAYLWDGTSWNLNGERINGTMAGDFSGIGIAINEDGTSFAIGSPFNSESGEDIGHVRVYENLSVGIDEVSSVDFSIYPNPVKDVIYINIKSQAITSIQIRDISGKLVLSEQVTISDSENLISVSPEDLSRGMYYLELIGEDQKLVKKFMKE